MRTFLWVLLSLDQLMILLLLSLRLKQYEMSDFAFREQVSLYSTQMAQARRQLHRLLPEVTLFWSTKVLVSFAVSITLFTNLLGPLLGLVYGLIIFLVLITLSRLRFFQRLATRIFESGMPFALKITTVLHPLWVIIGTTKNDSNMLPRSKDEFIDQLRKLPSNVLDSKQRRRLESTLLAEEKTVKQIMTVKKRAVTVVPSSTLGPILLSDLQKSGHAYFPVATKKGIPEGILRLIDISDINLAKQHQKAGDIMSHHISWVNESATVFECVQIFLKEKQYMLLVRNEADEYTGLVTISDLVKHSLDVVQT